MMFTPTMARSFARGTQSGLTLVELMLSLGISSVLLTGMVVSLQKEATNFSTATQMSVQERSATEMLLGIEEELLYAQGSTPTAWLVNDLPGGPVPVIGVDSTLGFPDQGTLLLSPGSAFEERIRYEGFELTPPRFVNARRGVQCTAPSSHPSGVRVFWAGSATPIEDQVNPPADQFDGQSRELNGDIFFRGDGVGFSYRIPVDPAGTGSYFEGDDIRWGARVAGEDSTDGWSVIHFEPIAAVSEADRGQDFNEDGDEVDVFDLGRLVRRTWNVLDSDIQADEFVLCPTMVLQERCNYGSDLDADGFEDPIFLWDPNRQKVRVRLFLLAGEVNEIGVIRRVESTIFMRNGARE